MSWCPESLAKYFRSWTIWHEIKFWDKANGFIKGNYISNGLTSKILIKTLRNLQGKWNESGFRPLLCTYRLNWARRNLWGWWDDWDDTVLQTQDSKFGPWRSEAERATSRHGGSPQYWLSHVDGEETFLFLSNRRDREPNLELWRER